MNDPRFEIVDDDDQGFHARYVQGRNVIWWTESYTRKENAQAAVAMIAAHAGSVLSYDLTASASWRRLAS